jgi:hypothetical protein
VFQKITNMVSKIICALSLLSLTLAQNSPANNNYLGSTPFERHSVNHTQTLSIIEAAIEESLNLSIPVNIAVVDPSALVSLAFDEVPEMLTVR